MGHFGYWYKHQVTARIHGTCLRHGHFVSFLGDPWWTNSQKCRNFGFVAIFWSYLENCKMSRFIFVAFEHFSSYGYVIFWLGLEIRSKQLWSHFGCWAFLFLRNTREKSFSDKLALQSAFL